MKIDKTIINTYNKQEIIHLVRRNPGTYCAQISRETGLSIPAVMKIMEQFVDNGIVKKAGKCEIQKGKHPETFEFIGDAYYLIGVDVGTTSIAAVLMDLEANIRYKYRVQTSSQKSPEEIFKQVNFAIESIYQDNKELIPHILGIGIGLAGIINTQTNCVEFSPAFGWKDVFINEYLKLSYSKPVIVENVTKAMALAEKWFGIARDVNNMLCVNLGYGIGSALMLDESIYTGDFHAAGELGHMVMEKDGPLCDCGNFGCLEAIASANAMAKRAQKLMPSYPDSLLHRLTEFPSQIEAKHLFDAANQQDSLSLSIVNEATNYIGIALANVINFMDINLIVLEGGMTRAGVFLLDKIKQSLRQHLIHFTEGKVKLVISNLGADAVSIGAATIILKKFVENGLDVEKI